MMREIFTCVKPEDCLVLSAIFRIQRDGFSRKNADECEKAVLAVSNRVCVINMLVGA